MTNWLEIFRKEFLRGLRDSWPFRGLGHIKSQRSLPAMYGWLEKSENGTKVIIAYAIFQINRDEKMIDIVLEEIPKVNSEFVLIDLLHLLPGFQDSRVQAMLDKFRNDKRYLVAYNATMAMGLRTEKVIEAFRNKRK